MPPAAIAALRKQYHRDLCSNILGKREDSNYFNVADGASRISVVLAEGMAARIGAPFCPSRNVPTGQGAGSLFAAHTSNFLERAFALLHHIRPGSWQFSTSQDRERIAAYDQYRHLAELRRIAEQYPEVKAVLGGDYVITPDIVVTRRALTDEEINAERRLVSREEPTARLTPLRAGNEPLPPLPTLHASISCKWTIRSDRAQNTRTEALNLIRNRKGKTPHIIVVTAEPTPGRINSIAVGTGDVDCTYHAALYELMETAQADADLEYQFEELSTLVQGRRLRDISDLPFDLAI